MTQKKDVFLSFYFHFLEELLLKKKEELQKIKFQSEEANTDEEIKDFLKKIIEENKTISNEYKCNLLKIQKDTIGETYNLNDVSSFSIVEVLLPKELTGNQKEEIKLNKTSVYTNPDLYLKLSDGQNIFYESVEIKTTKDDKIPGSSVQQINPFEWTIFIKHNEGSTDVACGYYLNAMTNKLPFPDRSPRPQIGFDKIKEWNKNNRIISDSVLEYIYTQNDINFKTKCLTDWEQILCEEWLTTIQADSKKSEKWFNNTIRKYTVQLLKAIKNNQLDIDKIIKKIEGNIN